MKAKDKKRADELCAAIEAAVGELRGFLDDSVGAYDEKSEKWQEGDKGQEVQEANETVEAALDEIDSSVEQLKDNMENLL